MQNRRILHGDMDTFFAKVEAMYDPALVGPYVVRRGRSRVVAVSQEAKNLGIKSGMTLGEAWDILPGIEFVDMHLERYAPISAQLVGIFLRYTDKVQPYAVYFPPEEAWLDLTDVVGSYEGAEEIALGIKEQVRRLYDGQLTISFGVAYSKQSSKMASDFGKPDGLVTIREQEEFQRIFWPLPAGKLWYAVGRQTKRKLAEELGIDYIGDIAVQPVERLVHYFGEKKGWLLHDFSLGIDDSPVVTERPEPSSVGSGQTIKSTNDADEIRAWLRYHTGAIDQRLQQDGYFYRTVTVGMQWPGENPISRSTTGKRAFNTGQEAYEIALRQIEREINRRRLFGKHARINWLRVSVSNLTKEPQAHFPLDYDALRL